MKLKFAFLNLFLGCITLFFINTKFTSNVKGKELQKVELNNEIKKGKFLIGLKQYLGGENDNFSKKRGNLKIFYFSENLIFQFKLWKIIFKWNPYFPIFRVSNSLSLIHI